MIIPMIGISQESNLLDLTKSDQKKGFTVTATNMNILYCDGIENPIKVGVDGYWPKDINISFTQGNSTKTGEGRWNLVVPNKYQNKAVQVKVSVQSENGETISMGTMEFRVKGPPPYVVRDNIKDAKQKKYILERSEIIELSLSLNRGLDWDFPERLRVISFECIIITDGGAPKTFKCSGNRLSAKAKKEINIMGPGQTVTILNIRVRKEKTKRTKFADKTFTYFIK